MGRVSKHHIIRWNRRLLLAGIVGFGLLFGAVRLLLPGIAEHRADIEQLAAEILDRPVTIRRIESGWAGFHPVVTFKGVQVQQPGDRGVFYLDSLDVVLGIIPSLLAGELRPLTIILHMQQLELKRAENGRLSFNLGDLADSAGPYRGGDQLDWILQQPDLQLDIDVFSFRDGTGKIPDIQLRNVDLDFVNQTDVLVARLTTGESQLADSLNVTVTLDTNDLTAKGYKSSLYLELKAASLSFWKQPLAGVFEMPDTGETDAAIWMKVEAGRIKQVTGDISLGDLAYSSKPGETFSVESMAGKFNWQSTGAGWLLQVSQLYMQRLGNRWPPSALSVEYRRGETNRFLINADYFKLQDFLPLVDRQPAVHTLIGDRLKSLSPAGEMNDLRLQLSVNQQKQLVDYALQSQVVNFSVNAHEQWPGVSGLDGYLAATEQAGLLQLSTTYALLDLPTIFRDPLRLDTLKGDINWTRLTSGLLIESAQLDADNSHISTQSRLSVHVPEDGDVFVDMQTNFKDGDGSYTSFYLPAKELGEETVAWLDKGIVAGHVEYGTFILHGAMNDFPFDKGDGRFEVRFKVRDGILDYYEDWPRIDEIEAEVAFVGRGMRIEASAGKIFEGELRNTVVSIADLDSDNPVLTIGGRTRTSSRDLFRYLVETKLAGEYEIALSALTLQGMNDLELRLNLPLSKGEPRVKGQLEFLGNQLTIDSWGLQIDKIKGLLDFTEQSFTSNDITGLFGKQQMDVNVGTVKTPDGPETTISARSQADLSQLIKSKNEVLANQFSGESPFEVLIAIPDSKPSRLAIHSSLVGTELKFPHPLSKETMDELEFSLQTGFSGESGELIEISLGDRLQALFDVNANTHELESAYVQLGREAISRPSDNNALVLGGRLDYIDLDAWKGWYQNLDIQSNDVDLSFAFKTDLKIDRMKYARWFVDNIHINTSSIDNIWQAKISGQGAEGMATYDTAEAALSLDLQHLEIFKRPYVAPEKTETEGIFSSLRPSDIPKASLDIHKLVYDEREVGRITVKAHPEDSRYLLDNASLKLDEASLRITGDWNVNSESGINEHTTRINVDIESSDFGGMMERFGYKDTVKGGESSLQASFLSDTSPMDFEMSHLSGEVDLSILKGEVLEVDPGSAGRIFGLLSFQTLPRRLSLDFSDLFSKGMSFDEIDGGFTVSQGQAYTNNLIMNAPSSQVEISGRIGLVDEDYDQHVRVIPNLSSTLPIAGALAGGPGLAVVMFITHKLLQKPIDKMTQFEYQITGPWDSPDIASIEDNNKVTSENKQPATSTIADDSL